MNSPQGATGQRTNISSSESARYFTQRQLSGGRRVVGFGPKFNAQCELAADKKISSFHPPTPTPAFLLVAQLARRQALAARVCLTVITGPTNRDCWSRLGRRPRLLFRFRFASATIAFHAISRSHPADGGRKSRAGRSAAGRSRSRRRAAGNAAPVGIAATAGRRGPLVADRRRSARRRLPRGGHSHSAARQRRGGHRRRAGLPDVRPGAQLSAGGRICACSARPIAMCWTCWRRP